MITVHIRKQGGAAIMTIPAHLLKRLDVGVGSTLELDVVDGMLTACPFRQASRQRYTLAELLRGVTPEVMTMLSTQTAWAREGEPVGGELA